MFDILALLLSSIATFLFPVFASYKALKTSDPAHLKPWLMYWVVLACALLFESWASFILFWVPFYSWIRLGFLLYLILPQTQGAKFIYQTHVHPFLHENERVIDDFISSAHDRAKAAGVTYLKQAITFIKQQLLGMPLREETPPPTPTSNAYSYTQSLMARFNLPSARPAQPATGSTSSATDFYGLLQSAVNAATSRDTGFSSSSQQDLSNSGTLIPPTVSGEERLTFIAAQRERLSILLSALDKEANTIQSRPQRARHVPSMGLDGGSEEEPNDRPKSSASGLSSRKSEGDFEKIDADSGTEEVESQKRRRAARASSGSWLPWSWGAQPVSGVDTPMGGVSQGDDQGKSSGVDA
ncbi:TB2/DP1, HVA22 family-domain-containing protein [Amylocarpus encephaloides]|uniref:Protein YOP1 n=1 Tax=Amylocarpus encephaloides TaxID=45428 RepID=A0A9P7YDG5_9HELO|nr:TB2/DP1, HVA22 family-domain-containing protein [Amylocarpus encephaloides]